MTTFEWFGPTGRGHYNYTYNENTTELSRSIEVARVYHITTKLKDHYRVNLSYHFNDLVSPNAYILRHKYPSVDAAQRAVERKVPGLVAVLKIQGIHI